jgi:RimJ/RimL family protein N-acetyltransferase
VNPSTQRLDLHPFTVEEAQRVVAGDPADADRWAPDYPMEDELDPLRSFIARVVSGAEPHPYTMYRIDEAASGLAIGGLGFFHEPNTEGITELGYGLVETARGKGYATEALLVALQIARTAGAKAVIADTAVDNFKSQKVMLKAGFVEQSRTTELVYYSISL